MPPDRPASDPIDEVRMSFGDHLEELRRRIIYALIGLVLATIICFIYGDHIIETLTAPYTVAMKKLGQDPRMVQLSPIDPFMEYFKISVEFGLVLAAPWILYQLWLFVGAGLYSNEKRVVRYFAPTSIGLFVVGAGFMIAFVLSGLLEFLIGIGLTYFPLPGTDNALYRWLQRPAQRAFVQTTQPAMPPLNVPILPDDPAAPSDGQLWINQNTQRLNARYGNQTFYLPLQKAEGRQFVQPFFSIAEYLDFVVQLALAFGLGFQIPLVVVLLVMLGILEAQQIAQTRRYVILGITVAAALITPTPDIATMMLLAIPMYLLFEAGLFVSKRIERRKARDLSV